MKAFHLCLVIAVLVCCSSCNTKRSALTYFEDIDTVLQQPPIGDYKVKIQPDDELLVTVMSDVPSTTSIYNLPQTNPATVESLMANSTPRQQTYVVDTKGDILFPGLGLIHVAGMDVEQLRDYLIKRISEYVSDPYVRVSLVNFVVNVAGEVKEPRRVEVNTNRFSVLDALTAAGDLTPYGMRENVLVIREENGKRTHARLDLNKAETFESPYFFLKQNDYVYVEPTPVLKDNADYNTNNSYKLSVISTIVSACSVITSLVIALSIK